MIHKIDLSAPIIPALSLGSIPVGAPLSAIYPLIKREVYDRGSRSWLENPFHVRYELQNAIAITVHILNGRILKVGALQNYKGMYGASIAVGVRLKEAISAEPRIHFDGVEGCYGIKGIPGITLETGNGSDGTDYIEAITVYHPALDAWTEENENGIW